LVYLKLFFSYIFLQHHTHGLTNTHNDTTRTKSKKKEERKSSTKKNLVGPSKLATFVFFSPSLYL